jgi:cyclase
MSTAPQPQHSKLPPPKVEDLGDGIFAYIQLDGSWGLNNTGFLVGRDAVTVIDTCFTERRTLMFLDAIRRVTALPPRTLVNTHHHGDHTHGNYLLLPAATIIGHELCREEVIATGHAAAALFPGVDWGKIEIAPPSVTVQERLNLYVDDLKVELICVGPAHTTNDLIAWIPQRKVLFTGDLIFNQGTPFAVMGSVAGWLEVLEGLRALEPETIVPGHGPLCGPEVIDEVADYLRFVQETARRGLEAGLTPLQTARQADIGRFSVWLDKERLVPNLHRAYSELHGEPWGGPLSLAEVMADMVAYNGGQMPRCLA